MATAHTGWHTVSARLGRALPLRLLVPWQAAWNHALARHDRRRQRAALSPRGAALALGIVWGTLLLVTPLIVLSYPQAVAMDCRAGYCFAPDMHTRLYEQVLVEGLLPLLAVGLSCLWPLGIVAYGVYTIVIKRQKPPQKRKFFDGGWADGPNTLLLITPPGAVGLLRIHLVGELFRLWQRRSLYLTGYGLLALFAVGHHVLHPNFWWLGGWGNWLMQLGLALLWLGVLAAWMVALVAYTLLNQVVNLPVDWTSLLWRVVSGGLALLMLGIAGHALLHDLGAWVRGGLWSPAWGDPVAASWAAVFTPLKLLLLGLGFAALHYTLAEGLLRLRLRFSGVVA